MKPIYELVLDNRLHFRYLASLARPIGNLGKEERKWCTGEKHVHNLLEFPVLQFGFNSHHKFEHYLVEYVSMIQAFSIALFLWLHGVPSFEN